MVRRGRSKVCHVPASFWSFFFTFTLSGFLLLFLAEAWCGLQIDAKAGGGDGGRKSLQRSRSLLAPRKGESSTGSREGCSLAESCACCRQFIIDSLGTSCKCNSPFSQSKHQCLQHSPGKAWRLLEKVAVSRNTLRISSFSGTMVMGAIHEL